MEEIWKAVTICPTYSVSNLGRIRRNAGTYKNNKERLITSSTCDRCQRVQLSSPSKIFRVFVHRLVVQEFLLNGAHIPPKLEVNHIDGNPHNNRVTNLEIVTSSENQRHAMRTGLQPRRWSPAEAIELLKLVHSGLWSIRKIARAYGCSHCALRSLRDGREYHDVHAMWITLQTQQQPSRV